MVLRGSLLIVAIASVAACSAPRPETRLPPALAGEEPTPVDGFVRELRAVPVTLADGSALSIEALVTRPAGGERAPLVVLTHGSPREGDKRAEMSPAGLSAQSLAFARHGYAVLAIMRRGYGRTHGPYVESSGSCDRPDYLRAATTSSEELLAALRAVRGEAWVDGDRVVLVGVSAGGLAALAAAATNPPGVAGVVSFAGGRGSDAADHVCRLYRLIDAMNELGRTAKVPSVWIYAKNDHYFNPIFAEQMYEAYTLSGAPAELVLKEPYGEDGHLLFQNPSVWWGDVAPFLAKRGLPTELIVPRRTPSVAPPPSVSKSGREAFALYIEAEAYEKAFAAGGTAWGWASGMRTREDAVRMALERCSRHGPGCVVYAVGDVVVR